MQVRWVATFSSILGATLESMFTEWWTLTICSVHTDGFLFFLFVFLTLGLSSEFSLAWQPPQHITRMSIFKRFAIVLTWWVLFQILDFLDLLGVNICFAIKSISFWCVLHFLHQRQNTSALSLENKIHHCSASMQGVFTFLTCSTATTGGFRRELQGNVCRRLSVPVSVRQCPSVIVSVCQCLSVSVNVCQCLAVSVNVCRCLSVSVSVSECLFVSVSV